MMTHSSLGVPIGLLLVFKHCVWNSSCRLIPHARPLFLRLSWSPMKWISSSTSLLKKVCRLSPPSFGVPGCRCSEKGNVRESAAINLYQRHRLLSEIALLFKTLILKYKRWKFNCNFPSVLYTWIFYLNMRICWRLLCWILYFTFIPSRGIFSQTFIVSYDLGAEEQGKRCPSGCERVSQAPFSVLRWWAVQAGKQTSTKAPCLFKTAQFKAFVKWIPSLIIQCA